ncbi:MAG TPA: DUF4349 domain-containing protein [Candidatus Limnocylindria bacterium]|nr:DUF4349 domain-containing protein [Candidatus Limnocylindria bacterium]
MPRSLIPGIAGIVLLLAACSGSGVFQNVGTNLADAPQGAPQESAASGERPGEADAFAVPAAQRIIKTGELSIEVDDVAASMAAVRTLAEGVGGYVGGSQAGTIEESATLTLRVPADRFEETLVRLRELGGTVVGESTREEDVTAQVVDLEARIDNLAASEASYRVLAERAEAVDDVLAVQARLDQVRGQIEQLQAQLDNVSGQAALSTLVVRLVPSAEPVTEQTAGWDPGGQLDQALAALVGIGQAVVDVAIWVGIVILPVALALALLAWIGLRVAPIVRRRAVPDPERVEP